MVEHGSAGLKIGFHVDGAPFATGEGARVYGPNFFGNKVTGLTEIAGYGKTLGLIGAASVGCAARTRL